VAGLIGLLIGSVPFVAPAALPLGVIAVWSGRVGRRATRDGAPYADLAVAGRVFGIIAVVLGTFWLVMWLIFFVSWDPTW
jgi:hypothetical protein